MFTGKDQGKGNKTDRPPNQDEEVDKMLGEVALSLVLFLVVGLQLTRYLQEIQPSREERIQDIPGVWERGIPDTPGE